MRPNLFMKHALVPLIAQTLKKDQGEDVRLVILACRASAKDIGCAPKMGFNLLLAEFSHECLRCEFLLRWQMQVYILPL